jgi:hypothetical protein
VSDHLGRVVALAAALAPERAGRLLQRLEAPGAGEARARVTLLASAPRRARLAALAAALAGCAGPLPPHRHPLLDRLALEAAELGPSAPRTEVRRAVDGEPGRGPRNGHLRRHVP